MIRRNTSAHFRLIDNIARITLCDEEHRTTNSESLIDFCRDAVLHVGVLQRDKTYLGIRQQRKDFLVWEDATEADIVQPTLFSLLFQHIFFCTFTKQNELNFFVLRLLCHIQQSSQSLRQTDIANIDTDSRIRLKEEDICQTLCSRMGTGGNQVPLVFGISSDQSHAMLSENPHAGVYEADTSRTLDCSGGSPACNQGGMLVVAPSEKPCYCIQGSMIGRKEQNGPQGDGINREVAFTLDTVDRHAVYAMTTGSFTQLDEEKSPPLMARDYKDPPVVGKDEPAYALDRACFSAGENAQYSMNVGEEKAPTLVAEGPGAVAAPAEYLVRRLTPGECCRLQGYIW